MPYISKDGRWRHLALKNKSLLLCGKDLAREPVFEQREVEDEYGKLEITIAGGEPTAVGASQKENVVITKHNDYGYPIIIGRGQNVFIYTGASDPSYQYEKGSFVIDDGRSLPCYAAKANVTYDWEYRRASGVVTKGTTLCPTSYAIYVSYDKGVSYVLYKHYEPSFSSGLAPNYEKIKAQSPVTMTFTKTKETSKRKIWVVVDDDDDY